MDIPKVGELLKVTVGTPERQNAAWLQAGDVVQVIENSRNVFMVEKLKGGMNGFHMRQCYPNNSWELNLTRIGVK